MAKDVNDQDKLQVVQETGRERAKDGSLRSFKDPAGTQYSAKTAGGAIEAFLSSRKDDLRTDDVDLVEVDTSEGAAIVRRRYEQRANELRIVGAELKIVADKARNSVISADSSLEYAVKRLPNPERAKPIEEVEEAILRPFAAHYESAAVTSSELSYLRDDKRPELPPEDYPAVPLALLRAGKSADGRIHLIYSALVETAGPRAALRAYADAISGELLYIELVTKYVAAKLFVYSPDPISESNSATLNATSSATDLDGFRHEVEAEVDAAVNGSFTLRGDWVRCNDFDNPTFNQPSESTASFKFQTHPADRRFLSANAYYWLDSIARYLQGLGVTTFNNNVERIEVDAQAESGADNSHWDGVSNPPRIHLGEGGVPDAADMGVVIHEYTHGVFDWLGSDHGGSSSYEHSVCDALPAIYRDRFNVNGHRRTETFPWDNVNNLWSSVRRLDMVQRFDDPGFNAFQFNTKNSMLATALWDCYVGMGGDSRAADAMIRTMMEMLLIVPDSSANDVAHAVSMAQGCMIADTALTGGLYTKVMDDAFIDRGLWTLRPTDLYIRDSDTDTGNLPSPYPHWTSPDIWVRNKPPGAGENPADGHQTPITNQLNYLYVKVSNRGTAAAAANSFTVETFRCSPGTGMTFPTDFTSMGIQTISQQIPAGGEVQVGPFSWTPTVVGHECLLAIVHGAADPAISATLTTPVPHAEIVRFDNNVGQRNVSPVASVPGGKSKVTLSLYGGSRRTTNNVTLDASALPDDTTITVRTLRRVVEGAQLTDLTASSTGNVWTDLQMEGGAVAEIDGFELATNDLVTVELTTDFSLEAEHLKVYPIVLTHLQDLVLAGRMTIEITSVKELEDWVFGNPRSRELHISTCPFWPQIGPANKIPFERVEDGTARGYNGCRFCLPDFDAD